MIGRALAVAATLACACDRLPARRHPDPFAWVPGYAPAVTRGKESGHRFGILSLHEVTVEIDNVFAAANRRALSVAEQRIAAVPGVRAVHGPASLLDVAVDGSGKTRAHQVLRPSDPGPRRDDRPGGGLVPDEEGFPYQIEGEAARQRVVRRADALGWFLTANGRRARFLVDTDDWPRVAPGVATALAGSGLALAPSGGRPLEARPIWPDPRDRGRWLPLEISAAWTFFALAGMGLLRLRAADRSRRRRPARLLAVAAGAAAPFLLVPEWGIRALGGLGALGALVVAWPRWKWKSGGETPPPVWNGDAAARAPGTPRVRGPSAPLLLLAAALVAAGGLLSHRVRVGTRQWEAAPLFFVSVRGDLGEPVVLREIRRLTDFLRAQPGVANAWSVADLFTGITLAGEEASRIPDEPDLLRRILVQARVDPAVRLELASDHREGLIAVRFEDDPTVDRLALLAALDRYLAFDFRRSLARVDFRASGVSPVARELGRGLLALDGRERVLRIAARSGRPLTAAQALSVERVARQAATIPAADPGRLQAETAAAVRELVARHPYPLPPAETKRLVDAVAGFGDEATIDDARVAVAAIYGSRLSDPILRTTAVGLHRKVGEVRRRLMARTNFRDMLYGADLPTEGVLADEVRGATLETMGPVVGLPVGGNAPSAFRLDPVPIGGAPNERALSQAWSGALRPGVVASAGLITLALLVVGGPRAVLALPLAFGPLAAAAAPAALLREPVGLASLSFFAGALAAGALLAVMSVRPRGRR